MTDLHLPFVCPECQAVSWHPDDLRHGYCGRCHQFTADRPAPSPSPADHVET